MKLHQRKIKSPVTATRHKPGPVLRAPTKPRRCFTKRDGLGIFPIGIAERLLALAMGALAGLGIALVAVGFFLLLRVL
jgi:hypothetical protein